MVTFTTPVVGTSPRKLEPFRPAPAARLGPDERKYLALHVLARDRPVTRLAAERRVSRKFAYRQAAKANDALDAAFDPSVEDDTILFQLPVTKKWIESADDLSIGPGGRGGGTACSDVNADRLSGLLEARHAPRQAMATDDSNLGHPVPGDDSPVYPPTSYPPYSNRSDSPICSS